MRTRKIGWRRWMKGEKRAGERHWCLGVENPYLWGCEVVDLAICWDLRGRAAPLLLLSQIREAS